MCIEADVLSTALTPICQGVRNDALDTCFILLVARPDSRKGVNLPMYEMLPFLAKDLRIHIDNDAILRAMETMMSLPNGTTT